MVPQWLPSSGDDDGDSRDFAWLAETPETSDSHCPYLSTFTQCQFLMVSIQIETSWKYLLQKMLRVGIYHTKEICFLSLNCSPLIKVCTLDLPSPGHGSACCVPWQVWWECLPAVWSGEGSCWVSAVFQLWDMTHCLTIQNEYPGRLQSLCLCSAHTLWPPLLLWDTCLFPVFKIFSSGFHLKEKFSSKQEPTYCGINLIKTKTPVLHRPKLSPC